MKFNNRIHKKRKKRDIIILGIFLILSILSMSAFLLTEMFMWTFNIYLTPNLIIACIHIILCAFLIFGILITLKPSVTVNKYDLLFCDSFNLIKKIPLNNITHIESQNNNTVLDDRYETDAVIVDVFYMNKKLRFALTEKDYTTFIGIISIK